MDLREAGSTFNLDATRFAGKDEEIQRYVQAIALAVERQRVALRADKKWGELTYQPPRGFPAQPHLYVPLIDRLSWCAVFAINDTPKIAAQIVGDATFDKVIYIAEQICPFDAVAGIHANHMFLNALRYLSPELQRFQRTADRIRDGGKRGGVKSAQRKRKDSGRPTDENLMGQVEMLLQTGRERKDVAALLAERFGVTATTIRRWLRQVAHKGQAKKSEH